MRYEISTCRIITKSEYTNVYKNQRILNLEYIMVNIALYFCILTASCLIS